MLVTQLCPTLYNPWTVAHQAPLSVGFPRQEYWSGLSFPSPGELLNLGIKPRSPELQADSLLSEPPGRPNGHRAHFKSGLSHFKILTLIIFAKTLFLNKALLTDIKG